MKQEPQISRLLSGRKGLSRVEKEAVFADVFAKVAPKKVRFRWPAYFSAMAAAACALFFLMRPAAEPEFVARGLANAPYRVVCESATAHCHAGEKLWFDFGGGASARYFAAFARSSAGTTIWYFPAAEGEQSVDLKNRLHKGVLDRAVEIGADYPAGEYEMYGVLSEEPLNREQVRALAESASPRIVKQHFTVDAK